MAQGGANTQLANSDVNSKKSLNWKTRVKICLGIAKGLAFLHHKDQWKPLIIHRYIEPANILLDKYLHPKISGFGGLGFAKVKIHTTPQSGYFDPEYFIQGTVNDKTDVYSFGVLILVLFSGKGPIYREKRSESDILVSFAQELKEKGDLYKLIDGDLNMQYSAEEATMILNLAIMCTSFTGKLRPTILLEVVNILEGKTKMKTPGVDPLSSTVVNSEVVISKRLP
ncbi:cold-responsive protein kinase 1-like [Papaver somniferum]|uniref:cold-responsive protein kinase 1-like n=1 Tax=Papaver somniferum TaxID=3469 RepID=UPI000E6FF0F5|nr:cold-responsive protein kinase 1-like [Papaver somniferum]